MGVSLSILLQEGRHHSTDAVGDEAVDVVGMLGSGQDIAEPTGTVPRKGKLHLSC